MKERVPKNAGWCSQSVDDWLCSCWWHPMLFAGSFLYISDHHHHLLLQYLSLVSFFWESLYYTDKSLIQCEVVLASHELPSGIHKSSKTDRPIALHQSSCLEKRKVYLHHRPGQLSSYEFIPHLPWCSQSLVLEKLCLCWPLWSHSHESRTIQVAYLHHHHQISAAIHAIFSFLAHMLSILALWRLRAITTFQFRCYCWLPLHCQRGNSISHRSWNARGFFRWFETKISPPSVDAEPAYAARSC